MIPVGLVLDSYDKVASGGGGGGSGSERSDSLPPCDADVEGSSSISSHASQVGALQEFTKLYVTLC